MENQNKVVNYEIKVKGHLGINAEIWFEDFYMEYHKNGITVLRGVIIDQAALHGVLTRIRDLGLTLISLCQIEDEE